jgi:outer membrane receptor protein involved in Fe transport
VKVLPGQESKVDGVLRPEFFEMEEYEVTAEEFGEQAVQILQERQQASSLLDAIGSEQFSKLGAGDAAEILSKVTGTSVADGKFAVIRGLADRYTSTTLNGADVPSADPNRKAAQLDLFPSQFIQGIEVSKTFSPDLPGGFAGGAINIVTRQFPDDFLFSLTTGMSYNTQSSLRGQFPVTDRGSSDWIAFDDGARALPPVAAATDPSGTTQPLDPTIKESFGSSQFTPVAGHSPVNSSMSLTIGDTQEVFGKRLGYFGGFTYRNDYQYYDNGLVRKYNQRGNAVIVDMADTRGLVEYTWGSLAGLALELSENHQLNFNYIFVQTAEDEARRLQGQNEDQSTVPGFSYVDQSILHWTERNLTYYQLKGVHKFPELQDVQFDWVGSLSSTTQDEPDHRIFQFFAQPGEPDDASDDFFGPDGPSQPSRPTRIFRSLQEDNTSLRGDLSVPLPSYNDKDNLFKLGGSASQSERIYDSRVFDVRASGRHPFVQNGDPNQYLDPANAPFINYFNFPANFTYTGEQTISAWYAMVKWSVLEWLEMSGGARLESTDIQVDTINRSKANERFSSEIQSDDLLPGLSSTFSIRSNLLLRAAWSQTVVRPTYREISRAEIYDVAQGRTVIGNQGLTMSSSENYDLRLEWYPREGELISLGVFAKKIASPIEQAAQDINNNFIFYNNYDKADVQGIEFELRENLGSLWEPLHELTLGLNYAYIQSEVPLTPEQQRNRESFLGQFETTRPLFDQPEYVLSTDLTWDHTATGTTLTIAGSVVGRRLVLVGLATPDEFEEPAPQLDVFLAQKIGKHWKAKFTARNLLDPVIQVSQDWEAGTLPIRSYTRGMTFGLSLACDF